MKNSNVITDKQEILKTIINAHELELECFGYLFDDETVKLINLPQLAIFTEDVSLIKKDPEKKIWKDAEYDKSTFFDALQSIIDDSSDSTKLFKSFCKIESSVPLILFKYFDEDGKDEDLLLSCITDEEGEPGTTVITFLPLPEAFVEKLNSLVKNLD